ncbi:MAG TPA: ERAP1-like C-terminal domain-containing protein, partial [Ilumatobacteraceae bacterium]|nr:ERAP1-like C-terminal domain-containing protein [Ilumatobacteraceae bacterium]
IDSAVHKVLLDDVDMHVDLPSVDSSVVVNAGGHGFMRVAYDSTLRARLVDHIPDLTIVDRYNLVDDAWNEVVAGRLTAPDFLTFIEYFVHERELAVWQAIAVALRGVGRLVDDDAHPAFERRVAAFATPALDDLGWEPKPGEDDLRAKLRGLLVSIVAVLGNDVDALARCREIVEDPSANPDLYAAAVNAVAAHGSDGDYEKFVERFRLAATPQDQLRFMYALAEFPDEAHMERTMDLALSGEVKTQNAPFLIFRCIANRKQGEAAWNIVRRRWSDANDKFPPSTIVRMIDSVKNLTSPPVVADVQGFFVEHPIPQGAKTLEQILERQRLNAALRERESERLTDALG